MICTIICSLCLSAAVVQLEGAFHYVATAFGALSLMFLNSVNIVLTFKERYILYKESDTFFGFDLFLWIIASCIVAVCFIIFQVGSHTECDDLEGGEACTLSATPNFAEWLSFVVIVLSIWILRISFYYDPKLFLQIKRWIE